MTTAPTVSEALKPCPFCGSAAYKTRFDDRTHIQCVNDDDCHARADVQRFDEADAIAIWNTRASAPPAGFADPIPATSGAMPSVDQNWIYQRLWYEFSDNIDKMNGTLATRKYERVAKEIWDALFPTADGQATKSGGVK